MIADIILESEIRLLLYYVILFDTIILTMKEINDYFVDQS